MSQTPLFRSHGANPEKLYEAAGIPLPPGKILDFSSNTNVLSWEKTLDIDLWRCLSRYPDDEVSELRVTAAELEGCGAENVLFLNGSNEGIYLAASLLGGKNAAVLQPAYGEYLRALSAYGVSTRNIFSICEAGGSNALFLCNPCNPTGKYIDELEPVITAAPDTLFVIDEAYIDFLTEGPANKINFTRYENVIILRSLTKIFHLCGARLGYALACRGLIERMKARQPAWSVNALAQAAGAAFMKDTRFVQKTREFYSAETPRFTACLREAGFTVLPTRTNFFLIETNDDLTLIRSLLEQGIAVRHTRNFPCLCGKYIRVATQMPDENDLFVSAMLKTEHR